MSCSLRAAPVLDAGPALGGPLGLPALLRGVRAPSLDALLDAPEVCDAVDDGALRWRAHGPLMLGCLDLPVAGRPMAQVAEAAYRRVFAALRNAGHPRLLRVWNYVPGINAVDPALHTTGDAPAADHETYRQFNAGRQAAFMAEGQDAFAGSPAACALGVDGYRLAIRFLAGRVATRAVDNPRQVPAWRYPREHGQRAPTFSRASLIELDPGRWSLWVSGTASIVGHASVHPGDAAAQTRETLRNLDAVLAEAARLEPTLAGRRAAELQPCVYLRDPADHDAIAAELDRAWGAGAAERAVWLRADVCRRELLVEIEGQLDATGGGRA